MRQEWVESDYYAVLGISKDASEKDIKKAYRKLAQQFHPDANRDDPAAEARFKEISEAYDVIGDPETRKEYDSVRQMGYFVGGPGGAQQYVRVEDLFGQRSAGGSPFDLFGGLGDFFSGRTGSRPRPGQDVSADLTLPFDDAIAGSTRQVSIDGESFKVKIPKGVRDGARIRLRGKGGPGALGGPNGDLYVTVHVTPHPLFERTDDDLRIEVPVTFTEAALGADVDVPTLDGKVKVRIPAGTQSGRTFRVRGRGVEAAKGTTGDLLVTVNVVVPTALTDEQRTLLEKLRDNGPAEDPRAHLGV
jgi:molecular chaperone DnaJ